MPVNGQGPYDDQNVFARILRDEIPARRVYEDQWAVAFYDIEPQAPVHVLVVPRGRYVALADFIAAATDAEIAGFFRAAGHVAHELGLEQQGYRLVSNMGIDAGQQVPHLHVHLFGGKRLGAMLLKG